MNANHRLVMFPKFITVSSPSIPYYVIQHHWFDSEGLSLITTFPFPKGLEGSDISQASFSLIGG